MYDKPRRTAYCEVWDEIFGPQRNCPNGGGPTRLVLQLVNVFDSHEEREVRAVYERNGRIHSRPPNFTSTDWIKALADMIRDPHWVPLADLVELRQALGDRIEQHNALSLD